MNFLGFKNLLEVLRAGNKQIPKDNDVLKIIIQDALIEVAQKTEPLLLITIDNELKLIKKIEDGLYLKEPRKIIDDNSLIEIDDDLIKAVAHVVISNFSDNDNFLKHRTFCDKYIQDYNWARYESFNGDENDLLSMSLVAIDEYGFKKIYIKKYKTADGYMFDWDESFITKLEQFFCSEKISLSKSDMNNIDIFLAYADENLTSEHEDYEIIRILDEYLGSL